MKLKNLKNTNWFIIQPKIIQEAILKKPPIQWYKLIPTGEQCKIVQYDKLKSQKLEDITCTVQMKKEPINLEQIPVNEFQRLLNIAYTFDVKFNDLEIWTNNKKEQKV